MRIIICSDIHGNAQALQSLLKTKDAKFADKIIMLGDIVCMGPQPNECIDMVKNDDRIEMIMGNHDKWIAVEPPSTAKTCKLAKIKHHNYMQAITSDENLEYLRNLPYYKIIKTEKTTFYFTHYGWKDNFTEVVDHQEEPENPDNIEDIMGYIDADVIFFGHNHEPLQFEHNNKKYICVGTLGMAEKGMYCVLTITKDGEYVIERKELRFNRFKTLSIMKTMKYPRFRLYGCYLAGTAKNLYKTENTDDANLEFPTRTTLFMSSYLSKFSKHKNKNSNNE